VSPFLTIAEAAEIARVSPKRIRNLMAANVLREGVHYTHPAGLAPRFKRAALLAWLDPAGEHGSDRVTGNTEPIPLASARRRRIAEGARAAV